MPNVFRNSPIDSLTQSVNALRGRQMQAEENQMRMMSLNSELANQEAERKLLPQKLKLEEDRLGYEVALKERGMDIETAKTAESILSSRMNRAVTMNQEHRAAQRQPFEMARLEYETRAIAQKLAYLPAQLELGLISDMQQNVVKGMQALTMGMPMITDTMKNLQEVGITAGGVMGNALHTLNNRFYRVSPQDPNKILGFSHPGMKQMYQISKGQEGLETVDGFAGQTLNEVMGRASEGGGFFQDGKWQEPSDGQITASLIKATSDVFKPKLLTWARQKESKKFASQFAVIDRVNAARESNQQIPIDDLEAYKKASDQIMGHISVNEKGEFKVEDEATGGDISMTIWENFYGGTQSTQSARDYMIGANEINTAQAAMGTALDIMNKSATLGTDILGGATSPEAQKAIAKSAALFHIDQEKLTARLESMYNGQTENELAIDMFTSPAEWGIIGVNASEQWGRHFFETDEPLSQREN